MAVFAVIASGQAVSSAFALEPYAPQFSVLVPSHAATWGAVRIEFSGASGTAPFAPLWVPGMSSAHVWGGAGPGFGIVTPPTPWGRISVSNSTAAPASFALYGLNG
jgi:hypothetical protein